MEVGAIVAADQNDVETELRRMLAAVHGNIQTARERIDSIQQDPVLAFLMTCGSVKAALDVLTKFDLELKNQSHKFN